MSHGSEAGTLALAPHLARDGQHVADLRLARAELAVYLGDGAGLHTACTPAHAAAGFRRVGTLIRSQAKGAPPSRSSSALQPVVMKTVWRRWCSMAVAVVKPSGTISLAARHTGAGLSAGWSRRARGERA